MTLAFEVIASVRLPTWNPRFAMRGGHLPIGLTRAVVTVAALATEAGRVDVHVAAPALGSATPLPETTWPPDLVVRRDRVSPPRPRFVLLGAATVRAAVGQPTSYGDPMTSLVAAWAVRPGLGAPIPIDARSEGSALACEVVHEGRAGSVVLRDVVVVARPPRSPALAQMASTRRPTLPTGRMEAMGPLAAIPGRVLFGDPLHVLRLASLDLFALPQRAAGPLAVRSLAGEVETSAIGGMWPSGKDHTITPRGRTSFARCIATRDAPTGPGHENAVHRALRAEVAPVVA